MRILMLLTDAFGGFGGIAKFNRDFLTALDASPLVERVYAWPRLIAETIDEPLPPSVIYERGFSKGKLAYVRRLVVALITGVPIDLVVCGHINLLPAAWFVAKARGVPLTLIIHGIDAWQPTNSRLVNALAGRIDQLISVSRLSAERFCDWSKVSKERVFILPNSVSLQKFTPGPKPLELLARHHLQDYRILLTIGRLESEARLKGFDQVLEVLPRLTARFPNLKYLIVGDGRDEARLQSKAVSLGVADNVMFIGRIPEVEKVAYYRLADAFVMPSAGEGFGIVLIEAAACGVPVIGSAIDGSAEALIGGKLGQLVDPTKRDEIVAAIERALGADAARSRNPLIRNFDEEHFVERVCNWLRGRRGTERA